MKLGGNLMLFVANQHSKFSMPHHQKYQKGEPDKFEDDRRPYKKNH
jgi:hypothetical protein